MDGLYILIIAILVIAVINSYLTSDRYNELMNEITNIRHEIEHLKDAINKD